MQIIQDNICKNSKIVDHYYKVVYKVVLNNNATLRYETPYNGLIEIAQYWTAGMVTLQRGVIKIRYNIHHINTYKYDTNIGIYL